MLDLRLDSPWMGHGGLACGTGLRASKPRDRCFSAGQTPDALNEGEQRTPAAYRTLARGGNYVVARRIERLIEHLVSQDTVDREKRTSAMTEEEKDKAKAAAVASVGAGVGSAGGATVGVLELAARGAATGLSAGLVIGLGAAAGAGIAYGIYRLFKKRTS